MWIETQICEQLVWIFPHCHHLATKGAEELAEYLAVPFEYSVVPFASQIDEQLAQTCH